MTASSPLTVLVAGATGATGRHMVDQLLNQGHQVRAIVRSPEKLPALLKNRKGLTLIQASILDLSNEEMAAHAKGCDVIASCLGHSVSFKGIYGHPRRLVTDAVRRLCNAAVANAPEQPVRFMLMNSTGVRNRDLVEPISFAQKMVIGLLRLLLPPHVDNEQAAEYLRTQIGQNHPRLKWVAVRPDGLTNDPEVTAYELHPSPTRSALFDAGKISRSTVGHFMAELIGDSDLWKQWEGKMPVIYARESGQ